LGVDGLTSAHFKRTGPPAELAALPDRSRPAPEAVPAAAPPAAPAPASAPTSAPAPHEPPHCPSPAARAWSRAAAYRSANAVFGAMVIVSAQPASTIARFTWVARMPPTRQLPKGS